ncbi:RluA family pseudouridine synthase [Candidatus Berkelbacteria bacterium]|nr:RluA family pseudouridine synthase [Candidatus Berkelbacteria bacterium]
MALEKPPGLVVHPPSPEAMVGRDPAPGAKHAGETLANWLRANVPEITRNFSSDDLRPGIVHRLDTDTSGIILVAKDPETLTALQDQFRARTVEKVYQALVLGDPGERGTLRGSIGRVGEDTRQGVKHLSFSWEKRTPKPAETDFHVIDRFLVRPLGLNQEVGTRLCWLELRPKTGRTHQLRVQLLDAGTPIIGDPMYSTKESREVSKSLGLDRQFLHATSLTFTDPLRQERVVMKSPLAPDLQHVFDSLQG